MAVKHLLRNDATGRLSYRRAYPAELRTYIPGSPRELKRSLKAKRIEDSGAWVAYQAAHTEYEATVAAARKKLGGRFDALDPPMIAYLAQTFKVEWLLADSALRSAGDGYGLTLQRRGIDEHLASFREWRASGDLGAIVERWQSAAQRLADTEGLWLDPSDPDRLDGLCMAINGAAIEACLECLARLNDEGTAQTPTLPQRPSEALVEAPTLSGLSFDVLARAYLDNPRMGVSGSTKDGIRTALRFLAEVHGLPTPNALTRVMVARWLDLMAKRPARLPKTDKRTLPELAAAYEGQEGISRMAPATQEKYCGALSKCWTQLQSRGDIPTDLPNPFRSHAMAPPAPNTASNGLSAAQMQAIFDLPIFTAGERPKGGRGEAAYWIPLILLWTGARPEEVAQLVVEDVFKDDDSGKWLIRFTDEGTHPVKPRQALKTSRYGTGRRIFPVPQALLELGLASYVQHLKEAGDTALFPLLTVKNKNRGELFPSFGAWWPGYIRKAGVDLNGKRPAREFRHNWTTAARACGVPKDAREYVQGHSDSKDSTNDRYGDKEPLGEHIHKVAFKGLDLSRVLPWGPPKAS